MRPVVSVVMPARNAEATISCALESVLKQSLSDLEVIVINDASDDSTRGVVEAFRDCRIRILNTSDNIGPASCRNLGLASASGQFVTFLDADDALNPQCLERLVGYALEYGEKAVLAPDIWVCKGDKAAGLQLMYRLFAQRGLRLAVPGGVNFVTVA